MNRLTNLTPAEKNFLMMLLPQLRASGKKLNQPNRHIVLNRARAQIESQRYATASVHYVRMSGSSPSLPGHVRARRAADCAFWRFSGADTPKLPAIHSCE